ncbi:MAG: isochorismate synthase, partial [bacterium]|nr:isochorismate synthase [bacterium]
MKDMTSIEQSRNIHAIYNARDAKAAMARRLRETANHEAPRNGSRVLRIEIGVENLDLLKWLAAQQNKTKFYFSGRDNDDMEVAGIGITDDIRYQETIDYPAVFKHIHEHLAPGTPNLKYYGGFSFSPGHIDSDWDAFGACRLVIPRFELVTNPAHSRTTFACNLLPRIDSLSQVLSELDRLNFNDSPQLLPPGRPLARSDSPGHGQWVRNLNRAIADIKANRYKKTVLARKVELEFETPPNPVALLSFLKHLPSRRYDFLFQFEEGTAFVGSSPERLYKRTGRRLESEAVAGTRSRGQKEQDDLQLAKELMDSDKEQREHDFVIRTIEGSLKPLCISMEVEKKKGLLKLKEGQHLITHLSGILKSDITDGQLIAALHPTPAVGGVPLDEALKAIDQFEQFKRGWYAGVIGAVGPDTGDFAVGLRSGRTHNSSLSLYSGVGIVEGSNPEGEWR